MLVVCLFDWLSEIEWNLKLFENWMRGNEMTFPNFHFAFWAPWIQILFKCKNPRVKMTWLLPFKMKRVFENIWILFGNILNSETLCNSMSFMREDKMTSSNSKKESWKFQKESNLKSLWKLFSIWSYLVFIQLSFLQK